MPTSYSEIVRHLESLKIMPDAPPSLEVMHRALDQIILNQGKKFLPERTIVVAGTNGKGSICATLETLFLAAGKTVGLYTSPHLQETTERIRLHGKPISQDLFCATYEKVKGLTADLLLTHFESLTLMAAWLFFSQADPLDWIIFEVGLGGTWDATNAIPHQNCVIASIGLDHEKLLGTSLTSIARNKFGIIGPDALVVHSPFPHEIEPLVEETRQHSSKTWVPSIPCECRVQVLDGEPRFSILTRWGEANLALPGSRAAQNTATALTLFNALGLDPTPYLKSLVHINWPGRMEKILFRGSPCPIYLSGDHNPQGIQSLLDLLPHYPRKHLRFLVGIGRDKNLDGILAPLFQLHEATVYLTESPFQGRKLTTDPLTGYGQWLEMAEGSSPDPEEALNLVLGKGAPEDLIVVTGSLYLVGWMKNHLAKD